MNDYTPGRYTGFKNAVYWMATKRHNWWGLAFFLAYVLIVAVAVVVALVQDGTGSALPWLIGISAYALLALVGIALVMLSLYWGFDLIPDREADRSGDEIAVSAGRSRTQIAGWRWAEILLALVLIWAQIFVQVVLDQLLLAGIMGLVLLGLFVHVATWMVPLARGRSDR